MKKLFFFIITLLSIYGIRAQEFGAGISGGYLSELDGFGGSVDLISEITEKWGVSATFTYAVSDESGIRSKWTVVDVNGRYKVIEELYLLAGGEYLSVNIKELGLGGGDPLSTERTIKGSDFGVNLGTGYIYNIADNVNVFAEVKYVIMELGYVHARLGLIFDF
jgi:opacity protein-like surface antigen